MSKLVKNIPPFSYPACEWAERLELLFRLNTQDITLDAVSNEFMPAITSRLPVKILKYVEAENHLKTLLPALMAFDKVEESSSTVLAASFMSGDAASRFYRAMQHKLKKTMPTGTPDDTIKVLAWARLCETLPPDLKSAVLLLDKTVPPKEEYLRQLDNAALSSSTPQLVAATSHQPADDRIDCLQKSVERLEATVARLSVNPPRSEGHQRANEYQPLSCYNCGKPGHVARNCRNARLTSGQVARDNFLTCFRCNKKGHRANNCRAVLPGQHMSQQSQNNHRNMNHVSARGQSSNFATPLLDNSAAKGFQGN